MRQELHAINQHLHNYAINDRGILLEILTILVIVLNLQVGIAI